MLINGEDVQRFNNISKLFSEINEQKSFHDNLERDEGLLTTVLDTCGLFEY